MAAGQSTRMYPITLTQPKPLVRIANKPILAHQLDQLAGLVNEVIVVVGYKSKMIQEAFGYSYHNIALGNFMQEFGGGGHPAAAACRINHEDLDTFTKKASSLYEVSNEQS